MTRTIHPTCYVHESAVIIGNVEIGQNCSVWPNAVIRGDEDTIKIGDGSNVQDCCVIHCSKGSPVVLGKNVSLGHGCVVHGAHIEDDVIIGMNATVLNGSVVGAGSIIGANALVKEGQVIPPGSLAVGVPAKVLKQGDASFREAAASNAATYRKLAEEHRNGKFRTLER